VACAFITTNITFRPPNELPVYCGFNAGSNRNEAECQFQNGSAQIIGTTKMISVTALEWTPEGLTTSIVTVQVVVAPHGVFKTAAMSVMSINAVSCSAVMKRVDWKPPFQVTMEPDSKLAPLTVRVNEEGVEPAERTTIVGVIVLIEGGGGEGGSHRHVTAASAAHQPNGCQSEGAKDKI
jgi:hypothetical protein